MYYFAELKTSSHPGKCFLVPSISIIMCLQKFLMHTHFTEVSGIQNTKLFTYNELKMATGNFHYSNKIGEGGFGVVYKVIAISFLFNSF